MEEDESKVNGGVWKVAVGGENWEKRKKRKKIFYCVEILF